MEEDGMKSRSFRQEEYSRKRRVFLRSYPLRWDSEEDDQQSHGDAQEFALALPKPSSSSFKSRVMAVFQWGRDKFLILKKNNMKKRRKKKKVIFYLVSCHPIAFKSSSDKLPPPPPPPISSY